MGMIRLSCAPSLAQRSPLSLNHWVGESDQLLETIVFTCFYKFSHLNSRTLKWYST